MLEFGQTNFVLTDLELRGCQCQDLGLKDLAEALAFHPTLRQLHVPDNGISDDGACWLAQTLQV